MSAAEGKMGKAVLRGPHDGPSCWRPVPANGFARNLFNAAEIEACTVFGWTDLDFDKRN